MRFAILLANLLSAPLAAPTSTAAPAVPLGAWSGTMTHRGETSPLGLELEAVEDGKVLLRVTLPSIHLHRAPVAKAVPRLRDGVLELHAFRLSLADGGETLTGVMPEGLVPVHAVPFTLRRVAELAPVRRPPLDAPRREPRWTFDAGSALWAGPTAAAGTLYFGGDDGRVHALEAGTGRPRWIYQAGGAVRCRPTVAGGLVFVASDDGWLHALAADDGAPRWKTRIAERAAARLPFDDPKSRYDRFGSDVTAHDGRLYVGTHEGKVLALEAASGRRLWSFSTGDAVLAAPSVDAASVFAGSYDGRVYGLDRGTGLERWAFDTRKPVVSSPALDGGRLVIGSRSYELFGLDAASGKVLWTSYLWMSWVESSAAIRDGVAYVGSSDAAVVQAHDTASGAVRWRADVHGWAWGQPAVNGTRVFVGTSSSVGYPARHEAGVLALDRATGKAIWRYPAPAPSTGAYGFPGSPALGDGLVFVTGLDGRVLAFSP